jgi:hypothetical protein
MMRREADESSRPAAQRLPTFCTELSWPSLTTTSVVEGKWRLESLLGEGGVGAVYAANRLPVRCRSPV